MQKTRTQFPLADQLRESLIQKYGSIVGGADLANLLGFRNSDTLRKAIKNETLPLATFEVPGRQGKFALTLEVANWLICLRTEGNDSAPTKAD